MNHKEQLLTQGWTKLGHDAALADWVKQAVPHAIKTQTDPAHQHWHRHANTWFAGVNALSNDKNGALPGGPPLTCAALNLATELYGRLPLDPAQVSIVSPGYPGQDANETDAAHNFRKNRDAAHVDGLNAQGPDRRRFLNECHAYILGIPISDVLHAPLVIWENSHEVMRRTFRKAFVGLHPDDWPNVDLTDIYKSARKFVFETCQRIEIPVRAGGASLVHRLTVHGVAPWPEDRAGDPRPILYFRPALTGGAKEWLDLP